MYFKKLNYNLEKVLIDKDTVHNNVDYVKQACRII